MSAQIKDILGRFGLSELGAEVRELGSGHIHDTWLCRGAGRAAVLQRINRNVFPDPAVLVENTRRVVESLAEAAGRGAYPLEIARPIGGLEEIDGEPWRADEFVEGSYAIDHVDGVERAARGSEAFGAFCAALVSLDPSTLVEVIPGFHDFDNRQAQLADAVRDDESGRASEIAAEFDFCAGRQKLGAALRDLRDELPRRVCHNDTKINNLLFDEEHHRPLAVVDLDTCMPGWWMHDFGDIVRTFCATEDEDSTRLDRVRVGEELFRAVCEGFTRPLASLMSARERESLWYGARAIPLMLAMRFLADHVAGDRYFRVVREGHNLERARNQLAIYRDLTARENELRPYLA